MWLRWRRPRRVVLIRTEPAEAARPEWWEACPEAFQVEFRAASLMECLAALLMAFPAEFLMESPEVSPAEFLMESPVEFLAVCRVEFLAVCQMETLAESRANYQAASKEPCLQPVEEGLNQPRVLLARLTPMTRDSRAHIASLL